MRVNIEFIIDDDTREIRDSELTVICGKYWDGLPTLLKQTTYKIKNTNDLQNCVDLAISKFRTIEEIK